MSEQSLEESSQEHSELMTVTVVIFALKVAQLTGELGESVTGTSEMIRYNLCTLAGRQTGT